MSGADMCLCCCQVTVSARGPTRILRVGPAREEEDEDKDAEDIG